MRDTSGFKQRFDRWKNGEKVYEAGKILPKYDEGTDNKTYLPEYEYEATVTPQGTSLEKHKRITNEEDWLNYWGNVGAGYVNKALNEAAPVVAGILSTAATLPSLALGAGALGGIGMSRILPAARTIIGEASAAELAGQAWNGIYKGLSGKDWSTGLADNIENTTGWRPSEEVTGLFNPGYAMGGIVKKGIGLTTNVFDKIKPSATIQKPIYYSDPFNFPEHVGTENKIITDPNNTDFILKTPRKGLTQQQLQSAIKQNQILSKYSFILPLEHVGTVTKKDGLLYPVWRQRKIIPYGREAVFGSDGKLLQGAALETQRSKSNELVNAIRQLAQQQGLQLQDGRILTPDGLILDFGEFHNVGVATDGTPFIFDAQLNTANKMLVDPIAPLPGYQLKMLMKGSSLEKQLSKSGTISVNSIVNQATKGSNVEKAVIDKVLSSEQFAGQKAVDYNAFRRAVQKELITYDRVPDIKYEDYGADRLGYRFGPVYGNSEGEAIRLYNSIIAREHDFLSRHGQPPSITRANRNDPGARAAIEAWRNSDLGREWNQIQTDLGNFHTMYPRFSNVNGFDVGPGKLIGHEGPEIQFSTFTFESPRIPVGNGKHYAESTLGHSRTFVNRSEPNVLHVMESQSDWAQAGGTVRQGKTRITPDMMEEVMGPEGPELQLNSKGRRILAEENPAPIQEQYLVKNYLQRQLQENLRYAAEQGKAKMRYPTRDTAAKIEGYAATARRGETYDKLFKEYRDVDIEIANTGTRYRNNGIEPISQADYRNLLNRRSDLRALLENEKKNTTLVYRPEHETILKKYELFPKQYKKLYKDADVRIVADPKGNTWYEVDVPENYLNQEWMFDKGKSIHIKPANKRAIFALNARKWHH